MTQGHERLVGKVALISGAGSGIGKATALTFAREGAALALLGRTAAKLEAVAEEIRRAGGKARSIAADVSDESAVAAAVDEVVATFGGLDIAFNNAGMLGSMAPLAEMPATEFDAVIGTNLRGVWLMARAEVRAMLASATRGSIINTSSFVARAASAGTTAYAASKAGVDAMTRALALEVGGNGIRVNSIAPGVIETEMFSGSGVPDAVRQALTNHAALKRLGQPDDIAEAALWLASDQAAFVTGQSILIDGGFAIPGLR
ncbi:oxidoreductase [Pleomorphomonas diazotrophica]|uniref:Oxidoreductase n=1 Tax=Pleomorphomonas diazotrophica TaxID=1166257 RepID=A0A1I4UJF8_9HYPH|nr:SDR family NAD(P)-dependent oxidoreductase [Pleomorphomonas diazotrophica]PKR89139.1 oxidoreductase [Pleomorphomonas diazotrophica]SFM89142.1 NAD(P)-dependent dehydrogenase, short-chain alcohol dehydrogenase family [Pleomorphomonas diazotrophica]